MPFDSGSLRQAALGEIQRIIREQDPPEPSTRLSDLGDSTVAVTRKRRTELGALVRQLRGDLDWIAMKALEKDRSRRHATATELAADLRRHMNHEPVLAGPPSATYRLRKFVRRKKGPVTAVVAVFLTLVVGLVVAVNSYIQADHARAETAVERDRVQEARRLADSDRIRAIESLAGLQAFAGLVAEGEVGTWRPEGGVSARWKAIVVHRHRHSAEARNISDIDRFHHSKGWDEIGYHFVIADDTLSQDGLIAPTTRWYKQKHGAHCRTEDNFYNSHGIGICLVGGFDGLPPTQSQRTALRSLILWLVRECKIGVEQVLAHSELVRGTSCPGPLLSIDELRQELRISLVKE